MVANLLLTGDAGAGCSLSTGEGSSVSFPHHLHRVKAGC